MYRKKERDHGGGGAREGHIKLVPSHIRGNVSCVCVCVLFCLFVCLFFSKIK